MAGSDGSEFGKLLRALRVAARLTQESLALRSKVAARTISDLERGKASFPHGDTVLRLADGLGLSRADRERLEGAAQRRPTGPAPAQPAPAQPAVAQPSPFGALIAEKTRDFVGREHVFTAIEEWLAANRCGYLTLRAEPGFGKSAIVAQYVTRTGCPAYFNQRASGLTRTGQFLRSIHQQLSSRLDGQAAPPGDSAEDERGLALTLQRLAARSPGERLVIAVDALDEVDLDSQDRGSNILYLPPQLPDNVYFLLTKREVTLPFVVDVPAHTLDLGSPRFRTANQSDTRTYLEHAAGLEPVARWLAARSLPRPEFVAELTRRSGANFMYLHHVVQDIVAGRFGDDDIDAIPEGLHGYYADHWQRMGMDASPEPLPKLKVIYVLLEFQEAVTIRHLARVTSEGAMTVARIIREWSQFLRVDGSGPEPAYSLYHESFADFLRRDEILAASRVDLAEINGMIADDLFQSR